MAKPNFFIIGDTICDTFLYGDVTRISAEAPVPICDVQNETNSLGGAFNVTAHLRNLGVVTHHLTVVGDSFKEFKKKLSSVEFDEHCDHFIYERDRKTSTKTRLISLYKNTNLYRYDYEDLDDISFKQESRIISKLKNFLKPNDCIILMDYCKGVVTESLARKVIDLASDKSITILVDTKRDNIERFEGANYLKPNNFEFEKIKLRACPDIKSFKSSCAAICRKFKLGNLIVTKGKNGLSYYAHFENKVLHLPGFKVDVRELSGAGDALIASFAFSLINKKTVESSLEIANFMASKFINSGPTYRLQKNDLHSSPQKK